MSSWEAIADCFAVGCPTGGWRPERIAAAIPRDSTAIRRQSLGESAEGRSIDFYTASEGPTRVLLWSQMHGDEPTHTTALINLLRLLSQKHAIVERIARGLTLGVITPLNPDGAERCTRQNACGVDVNRDFRAFATPEACALRSAFKEFGPAYALNLHNQPHRRAMPDEPRRPASLSLQVPPLDEADTQTDSVRQAVCLAALIAELGAPHCEGRVSRYPADYMPRASGDWAQGQRVPTVLVEAGGWLDGDFDALERFHFALLVQTLDALAAASLGEPSLLQQADPGSYLDLPSSSRRELFDLRICPEAVASHGAVELGVNFPAWSAASASPQRGRIAAVGDLQDEGGLQIVPTDAQVAPGRIVQIDAKQLGQLDEQTLFEAGVTTLLVTVDLAQSEAIDRLEDLQVGCNHALVVACSEELLADDLALRLAIAIEAGAVATWGALPAAMEKLCCHLGLPALHPEQTPSLGSVLPSSAESWLTEVERVADALRWPSRGRIKLQASADFALVKFTQDGIAVEAVYVDGLPLAECSGERLGPRGEPRDTP